MDNSHDNLEQRLDEAGRWAQPRDARWDSLLDRLGPQDELVERPGDSSRPPWLAVVVAAGLLIVMATGLVWLSQKTHDENDSIHAAPTEPIEVERRGVTLTVFSASQNSQPTLFMPLLGGGQGGVNRFGSAQQGGAEQMQMDTQELLLPNPGGNFGNGITQQTFGRRSVAGTQQRGMALVKDRRLVMHLKQGDNLVKFTDVAATIDPTSVRLTSDTDPLGTQVVEQNFEFDLATADALLKRFVDKKVSCVERDSGELIEGFLVSFDAQTLVLADAAVSDDPDAPRPKTEAIVRSQLQSIRVAEMPADLYTRPTLVWRLRTKTPGNHEMTLSYLCGQADWQADYNVLIREQDVDAGDTLDIKGWVSIDNRSGATFEQAGIKLIAGDVNRVPDPWAMVRAYGWNDFGDYDLDGFAEQFGEERAKNGQKKFSEKTFFEYKLYTLSQPSTVKDRQIKQLNLLKAGGVKARRRYLFDPNRDATRATVQLLVANSEENHLGRPLPKGRVTFTAVDADGETQFLGRDKIDHTPKDEELELNLAKAFDVVCSHKQVRYKKFAHNHFESSYEMRIRNHKETAINVRAVGHLVSHANWKVTKTTDKYTKHDFKTLHFDCRVESNTEKKILYTVEHKW
jgi:hypothetical protein